MIIDKDGRNLENLAELVFSQYANAPDDMRVCNNPFDDKNVQDLLKIAPKRVYEIASRYNNGEAVAAAQRELLKRGIDTQLRLDPDLAKLAYGDRGTRCLSLGSLASDGGYILMPQTDTYALGAYKLREACIAENNKVHPKFKLDDGSEIYRPLTFKETLEARLQQKDLFNKWNDTCTSITYKANSTQFKITPISKQLITINKNFAREFLPANYNSVQGTELDSTQDKYNELLLFDEVPEHQGWLEAAEGDKQLLKKTAEKVWETKKLSKSKDKAMGFRITQNPTQDQLRALFVYDLSGSSNADGNRHLDLYYGGSFVRAAQPQKPA